MNHTIIAEIPNFYRIIRLKPFRHTAGVSFDILPKDMVPKIDAIDRVLHKESAVSPGPVGDIKRPWYMHTHQDDNLIVLGGTRHVDVYIRSHGKIESFIVTPDRIEQNGELLFDGAAMLVWPRGVFHRVASGNSGSASVNLATHYDGIDMDTNFNIYDLDTATGTFSVLREGFRDQQE